MFNKNTRLRSVVAVLLMAVVVIPIQPNRVASEQEQDTDAALSCIQIYNDASPWNKKIPASARAHPNSRQFIQAIGNSLGSNPDAYTIPVYLVNSQTPLVKVRVRNSFRDVVSIGPGRQKVTSYSPGTTVWIRIPKSAQASDGSDRQLVLLNPRTKEEWGLYRAEKHDNRWEAAGMYHYNVGWTGVPPNGFAGRGGGSPYLAGLVRKCEIDRGYIGHALVMGYDYPCIGSVCRDNGYPAYIYPAIKTDGDGRGDFDIPEGARLQLNPNATSADIRKWCGTDRACRLMVRAMQDYGVYLMENSGNPKVYVEDNLTANWGRVMDTNTIAGIPISAFRVLDWRQ
jgi:hypothetical protein